MKEVINYGKTWSFTPQEILYPENKEELIAIVKNAKKMRVMGSRHSWSKGIVTEDTLVSLAKMNKILGIDKEKNQANIEAGRTLSDIITALEKEGYAFMNLGSVSEQSLIGAICTATHGTGIGFQCLASQVESFKIIDAAGNDIEIDKNHPDFNAIITGFGCFGVIYEVVLNIIPSFQMHALTETMDFDEFIDKLDIIVKAYDHVKFWWLVPNQKIILFKNKRTSQVRNDNDFVRFFKDEVMAVAVYRTLVAIGKLNRQKFIPKINNFLTQQVGKKFDRICKSYISFLTPVPPIHRETEWAFDYKDAQRLLKEFKTLLPENGDTYNFVQEVRFTKGDAFWLSPAFERDTIWLTTYNMDTDQNWDAQLEKFETFAKKNGGRPHWGKESTVNAGYLETQYSKMDEFKKLVHVYDPKGKFQNKLIEQIFNF